MSVHPGDMDEFLNGRSLLSRPFWAGCFEGMLRLQQCGRCQLNSFVPRLNCQHCGASELAWTEVDRTGSLLTFSTVFMAPPRFREFVPYTVGIANFGGAQLFGVVAGERPYCEGPVVFVSGRDAAQALGPIPVPFGFALA